MASAHVRGVAAASRLGAVLRDRCASLGVVVRRDQRGVSSGSVSAVLADEVLGELPYSSALVRRCDSGEGPALRDAYGRAVRRLLPMLVGVPSVDR